MDIFWKYIDKRSAAVAALKDRPYMQYIIDHTDDQIKEIYANLTDPSSVNLERVASSHDVHAGETKLVGSLESIGALENRYEEAIAYMNWFTPAWERLNENERYILESFYGEEHEYGDGAIDDIAEHFNIERSSAYRRKNRAVEKLAVMLYGR